MRAAVEAIVPAVGGSPGAADLGVHEHVLDSLERFVAGFGDLLVTLLDAYAGDVRAGAAFTELDVAERQRVLRAMSMEASGDMADVVEGLLVFTYGGMYSEWTGYDRATRTLTRPRAWDDVGFAGPVRGHPVYRGDV